LKDLIVAAEASRMSQLRSFQAKARVETRDLDNPDPADFFEVMIQTWRSPNVYKNRITFKNRVQDLLVKGRDVYSIVQQTDPRGNTWTNATISTLDLENHQGTFDLYPLLLWHFPTHFVGVAGIVDKCKEHRFQEVDPGIEAKLILESEEFVVLFDRSLAYSPVRCEWKKWAKSGKLTEHQVIQVANHRELLKNLYVPRTYSAVTLDRGKESIRIVATIDQIKVNEALPSGALVLRPPNGTKVADRRIGKAYIVKGDWVQQDPGDALVEIPARQDPPTAIQPRGPIWNYGILILSLLLFLLIASYLLLKIRKVYPK
jgi:hypothetical protein